MRITKLLIFVIIINLFSCEIDKKNNSNNSTDTSLVEIDDTILNINNNIDSISNLYIIQRINLLDSNYLPYVIKKYKNSNAQVSVDVLNDFSAVFSYQNKNEFYQTNSQIFSTQKNNEIICFSSFKLSDSLFVSYFYFLQNYNGYWSNISQLIMTDEVLLLVENELNSNIEYKTSNRLSAFYTEKTKYPVLFDFSEPYSLKINIDGEWQKISDLIFDENRLTLNKNEIVEYQNKLLNSSELDIAKRYTLLDEAIEDSINVYILDLSSSGMKKLSKEISLLKRLQILVLDENFLTELPKEIELLTNLQILRSSNNKICSIPENIGDLKNLEEISFSFNQLDYLPLSLSKLTNLKVLNIDHNKLSNLLIDFSQMKQLVILNISDNNIKQLPVSIGKLDKLVSLNISNNPIEALPSQFFELKNLTYFDVRNTKIPDSQLVKLMQNNPDLTIVMD